MSRVLAPALLLLAALAATGIRAAATAADPALEPYERLARAPRAACLLAAARSAMESHRGIFRARSAAPAPNVCDPHGRMEWPGAPVGLYVSLVRGRVTRACVGRAAPTQSTLSEAVRALAVEVLDADRRRPPVRGDELGRVRVVISFAGEGEAVADPMLVDPGREGLLVQGARGVVAFLPGEARTVRWALSEARRIGVLEGPVSSATYRRFPVVVIAEPRAPSPSTEGSDAAR